MTALWKRYWHIKYPYPYTQNATPRHPAFLSSQSLNHHMKFIASKKWVFSFSTKMARVCLWKISHQSRILFRDGAKRLEMESAEACDIGSSRNSLVNGRVVSGRVEFDISRYLISYVWREFCTMMANYRYEGGKSRKCENVNEVPN